MKSMQRYSKVHTLTAEAAEAPRALMVEGESLTREWHEALRQEVQARASSTGARRGDARSPLGNATLMILRALPTARCGTQAPEQIASAPPSPRR